MNAPWKSFHVDWIPFPTQNTYNLGDAIQAYAAKQLYPDAQFVERDNWHNGMTGNILMCGWWKRLPLVNNPLIKLIFSGTHLTPGCQATIMEEKVFRRMIFTQIGRNALPFFARSYHTRDFLLGLGIQAVFGGCITQTLENKWQNIPTQDYVVYCNVPENLERVENVIETSHFRKDLQGKSFDIWLKEASAQLNLYLGAKMVYTTLLHCFLPCVAMGVPCQLLASHVKQEPERLTGYYPI